MTELQRDLSAQEFGEYLALDLISPWCPERGDIVTAQTAYVTAAAAGAKVKMDDFVIQWDKALIDPPDNREKMRAIMQGFASKGKSKKG